MLQQIMMMFEMLKAKAALQQQVGTVRMIRWTTEGENDDKHDKMEVFGDYDYVVEDDIPVILTFDGKSQFYKDARHVWDYYVYGKYSGNFEVVDESHWIEYDGGIIFECVIK